MLSLIQALPRFKGKFRLFKVVINCFSNKKKERIIKVKSNLKFKIPNLFENLSFELLVNGIYEKHIIDYLVGNLPNNSCLIDIGANIGAISIFVAKERPDVQIYAIEASPRIYKFLNENVLLNKLTNVKLFNFAIHENDNVQMNFYAPEEKFGKGSFAPIFTTSSELVKTKRLDTFFEENGIKPDIIKVDVEGFELLVFKSMSKYFRKCIRKPQILFEFVDWAENLSDEGSAGSAQEYLLTEGFSLYKMNILNSELTQMNSVITEGSEDILAL